MEFFERRLNHFETYFKCILKIDVIFSNYLNDKFSTHSCEQTNQNIIIYKNSENIFYSEISLIFKLLLLQSRFFLI